MDRREKLKYIAGLQPLPDREADLAELLWSANRWFLTASLYEAQNRFYPADLKRLCNCYPVLSHQFENAGLRAGLDGRMAAYDCVLILKALAGSGISPVLLKGGAYIMTAHPAAAGRRLSDLDILVPAEDVHRVEERLLKHGWSYDKKTDNPQDYDYYRHQMHELPPLRHGTRHTLVDVHFRLLPVGAKFCVDHAAMTASAVDVQLENELEVCDVNGPALRAFTKLDMVIHAAVHAFLDGELTNPERSLIDLYHLLSSLSAGERANLYARADTVGAAYALAACNWVLADVFGICFLKECPRPSAYLQGLLSARLSEKRLMRKTAELLLWLRGHWLRAPIFNTVAHGVEKIIRTNRKS